VTATSAIRRAITGVLLGIVAAVAVATPALADPPGPTDYRSSVRSIEPATPTIDVGIVGGDSFVELRVQPGTEAIVVGYEGEDYLWFRPDGVVLENQNSPATYLNADRYGTDAVPATARADAEPDWKEVAGGGYWAWHDHRAHWMQSARPFGLEPGDQILEAVIPILVDGDTVEVTVVSTWQPEPSSSAMWLGVIAGVAVTVAAFLFRAGPIPSVVAAVPTALLALYAGYSQYTSLPAQTGPRPIWLVLPVVAVLSAAVGVVLAWRGRRFASDAALLLVGVELAIWGFVKRDGLTAAILPTDAPFWLDRFVTTWALVGGVGVAALALWWLFATGSEPVNDPREPSGSPHPVHP
jgi:hypothetical protein